MDAVTLLDARPVAEAIEGAADVAAARDALLRIVEAHPDLADELISNELLCSGLVAVACASRSLVTAIVNDEALLDALRDAASMRSERYQSGYRASFDTFDPDGDPLRRLRRWKRREYLRIAARDLLGFADLPAVGRELAGLAAVSLEAALAIAAPTTPFAVIGMGKLGGAELNYASDVDVLFVHDGASADGERVARALLDAMRTPTADGIVFRTDADLRPEGRAGALTRNCESYESWYERWARPWEFQALIKARPIAGDPVLGEQFMTLSRRYVWRSELDPDAVREARAMKARAEAEMTRRGLDDRELKRGRGGIRDIEFAVQLLQLVHGRHDEAIRSAGTLEALSQLAHNGYIEEADEARLTDAYIFLRTVEHRLQLWEEQQTHTLPAACSDIATRATRLRSKHSRHSTASTKRQFDRFTSGCSSHQSSTHSPVSAPSRPRPPRSVSPHSASSMLRTPAPRSASSRAA